jgi:hypothetical protein
MQNIMQNMQNNMQKKICKKYAKYVGICIICKSHSMQNNIQNMPQKYFCEVCDYECCKKSSWSQHLLTSKHQKANLGLMQANKEYACEKCNIKFIHQSSYCRHKKKCCKVNNEIINTEIEDKDLIMMLVKQISELLEVIKNGTHNKNNSHNNTNSHNKTFNLQFFLNEQCKDALNINEFVDSIKLQLSDLEDTGRLGYVDGISKIILKNLQDMDKFKRPIHCSDLKREVIYIKSNNTWTRDDENNEQMKAAVRQVTNKNIRQIAAWAEANPNCRDPTSKKNDQYLRIVSNAMSGISSEEQSKNMAQIIRNVAREVVIEKN